MSSKSDRSQIINVLLSVMEHEKKKGASVDTNLLHQERLLLLATEYLSGGLGYAELGFDFTDTFEEYTMAVNKIAMEQFNANNQDKATNYLLKAIDLLMNKNIHKFVRPIQKYGELKVLTYNNLACIYQKRKQFALALKSLSFAVDLEEKLVADGYEPAKTSIVSTLLNKAAIQNSLNKHDKAQESLYKALIYIDKRNQELNAQESQQKQEKEENKQNGDEQTNSDNNNNNNNNNNKNDANLQNKIEEIRKEELKALKQLKMMCYYNIGAEDEHLFHSDRAKQNYNKSKAIAEEIQDSAMKDRLQKILDSLK